MFDAERGWVLAIWCPSCGLEAFAASYRSHTLYDAKRSIRPSVWAFQVGGKNWLMYHRDYYPTGGPYKWRRWHKGGDLRKRYESLTFRPSLEPEWHVTEDLPECEDDSR